MRRTSFNAHGELVCPEGRFVQEPTPYIPGQCLYGEIGHIVAPGAPTWEKVRVGRTLSARGIRTHYDEYHDYHHEIINAFKADPEQKRVDAEALAARVEGVDPRSPCGEEDFGGGHVAEFFARSERFVDAKGFFQSRRDFYCQVCEWHNQYSEAFLVIQLRDGASSCLTRPRPRDHKTIHSLEMCTQNCRLHASWVKKSPAFMVVLVGLLPE